MANNFEIREEPYAFVLNQEYLPSHCSHCFKKSPTLTVCQNCQHARFCGEDCKTASFVHHKVECAYLKHSLPFVPSDKARLVARILFRQWHEQKYGSQSASANASSRTLDDLLSHEKEVNASPGRTVSCVDLCHELGKFIGVDRLPTPRKLLQLYGKVVINSFSIQTADFVELGRALYLRLSQIDHSCDANAVVFFDGPTAVLRPVTKAQQFDLTDFSKIRINYIDIRATTAKRRSKLQTQYYFYCDCKHCSATQRVNQDKIMTSLACSESACSSGFVFLPAIQDDSVKCSDCDQRSVDIRCGFDAVEKTKTLVRIMAKLIVNEDFDGVIAKFDQMESTVNQLHKLNIFRTKVNERVFLALNRCKRFEDAVTVGQLLIDEYKLIYPEYHPIIGNLLLDYANALMSTGQVTEAKLSLLEAREILVISQGPKHATTQVVEEKLRQLTTCL